MDKIYNDVIIESILMLSQDTNDEYVIVYGVGVVCPSATI